MAWQKLDDELTDPTQQEPLSGLLVRGLTRNANGYAEGLARTATFAFDNQTLQMQWASYDQPTGFVFTVDVGANALQVQFDIVGNTLTNDSGGTLVVTAAVPVRPPAVAVTVVVADDEGAVNRPADVTVPPPVADQANVGCVASGTPN